MRPVYHLSLRQTEGLIASILARLGLALPVPDHTTLPRLGRTLRLDQHADAGCGLDLAIDSTGLRLAKLTGAGGKGWRKLHIAVDPDSGHVLAEDLTRSGVERIRGVRELRGRSTPIYAEAIGEEERAVAARMWR